MFKEIFRDKFSKIYLMSGDSISYTFTDENNVVSEYTEQLTEASCFDTMVVLEHLEPYNGLKAGARSLVIGESE